MAMLQNYYFDLSGELVITCAHIKEVQDLCSYFHRECVNSGGTPAGDCAVPILQSDCP